MIQTVFSGVREEKAKQPLARCAKEERDPLLHQCPGAYKGMKTWKR